jgi:hypothetical protein
MFSRKYCGRVLQTDIGKDSLALGMCFIAGHSLGLSQSDFVCMESFGMQVLYERIHHTIELLIGLINNKIPWCIGGYSRSATF